MTISFHQYGNEFFPGSGKINEIGEDSGKYYSINIPLASGCSDNDFIYLFEPIITKSVET